MKDSGFNRQQSRLKEAEQPEAGRRPLTPDEVEAILNAEERGICVTGHDGICRFVNSRLSELLGYSRDEMLGCPIKQFLPSLPDLPVIHGQQDQEAAECRVTRKGGGAFPARVEIRKLDGTQHAVAFVVSVHDITEQKHVEELLQKTERLASAGRMAAAIAHEINNPLEAVTNLLFLLRNQELAPESMHLLSLAELEIDRVSRIARQTLAFYRESGKPTRVDLRELLNLSVDVHGMRKPGIKVHRRYRTTQMISGYASELQQVFHNMVANSVEAGATDLWLHLHRSNGSAPPYRPGIRITIADNGCGIDPTVRPRIFNPFITTKGEKGTGLGLWVSRGIILRHEGNIRVRTSIRPNHAGTCMTIYLPR